MGLFVPPEELRDEGAEFFGEIFDEESHLKSLGMIIGDEFVSLGMELFSNVPGNWLTISENDFSINEGWHCAVSAWSSAEGLGVGVLKLLGFVVEILFDETELNLFFSDSDVGLSSVRTHFVGEESEFVHLIYR